ncbi:MAG: helix-turn-helix transcriptional regulator [Erythrobacter sp.]
MDLRRNLAKNLRVWRTERVMSQEEFADLVGVHRTYVSQIEGEKRAVSIDVLGQMAEAMKVSPADLLSD